MNEWQRSTVICFDSAARVAGGGLPAKDQRLCELAENKHGRYRTVTMAYLLDFSKPYHNQQTQWQLHILSTANKPLTMQCIQPRRPEKEKGRVNEKLTM